VTPPSKGNRKRRRRTKHDAAKRLKQAIEEERKEEAGEDADAQDKLSASEAARRLTANKSEEGEDEDDKESPLSAHEAAERLKAPPAKEPEEDEVEEREVEPPGAWQRHDLAVVLVAVAALSGGAFVFRTLTHPTPITFSANGLSFERPAGWLPAKTVEQTPSKLALAAGAAARNNTSEGLHVIFEAPPEQRKPSGSRIQDTPEVPARIEVEIEPRPSYDNLPAYLEVRRASRFGEFYFSEESGERSVGRKDWQHTRFRYAYKVDKSSSPQISTGIEFSAANSSYLFVITVHGSQRRAKEVASFIAGSLSLTAAEE
jgi:hypothetical protein